MDEHVCGSLAAALEQAQQTKAATLATAQKWQHQEVSALKAMHGRQTEFWKGTALATSATLQSQEVAALTAAHGRQIDFLLEQQNGFIAARRLESLVAASKN